MSPGMSIDSTGHEPGGAPGRRDAAAGLDAASPASDGFVRRLQRTLETAGAAGAIALLNGRTRFRYTGIYRALAPQLRNLYLFDRENPTLNVAGATTPLEATYCSITCASGAPFTTDDAGQDERLVAHPARASVISYRGVPLRRSGGRAWGTLCHFDVRPRLMPPHELELLDKVAPLLAEWVIPRHDD